MAVTFHYLCTRKRRQTAPQQFKANFIALGLCYPCILNIQLTLNHETTQYKNTREKQNKH